MILTLLVGAGIGISLGLLGAGGSVLAVPALVYVGGQPVADAVRTSLLVVAASATAGAIPRLRAGGVPWRSALAFGLTGIVGALGGGYATYRVAEETLLACFGGVLLVAGLLMFRRAAHEERVVDDTYPDDIWRNRPVLVVSLGLAAGFLCGFLGVGGGFLIVPVWTVIFRYPIHLAVGASLIVIAINALAGFGSHLQHAQVDVGVAAAFVGFGVVGAVVGARLGDHVRSARLSRWFGWFVASIGVFIVAQVWLNRALVS